MLRASYLIMTPLDIVGFLAVQESDDELVNSLFPIRINVTSVIAKVSIDGIFPRGLEVSVENFGELGITFHLCPFLLLVGLQELRLHEGNKELNTVGPIIGYHLDRILLEFSSRCLYMEVSIEGSHSFC